MRDQLARSINFPEQKLRIPFTEKLKSIPEVFGIRLNEQPDYEVLKHDGHMELRRYERQLVARITLNGLTFDDFREAAFHRLASYIFGGNSRRADVAMTSPVLQEKEGAKSWTMSFILPVKYNLENAPRPADPAIKLLEVADYLAATITYSGSNSLRAMRDHQEELDHWLRKQAGITKHGSFFFAQFDAPFVLPFLRRNEVQVKIKTLSA